MEAPKTKRQSWRKTPTFCSKLETYNGRQFYSQSHIRRLQNRILDETTLLYRHKANGNSKGPREKESHSTRNRISPRQECNRNCRSKRYKHRVLFNNLHCSITDGGISSHTKSEKIKQIHKKQAFQTWKR